MLSLCLLLCSVCSSTLVDLALVIDRVDDDQDSDRCKDPLHKIAYMNLNIARDLHCFTMRASVIPVGPYKSYNFHISVKSALLSDLKYDKRSSTSNGVQWY